MDNINQEKNSGKLTLKTYLGYGSASMSDALAYNFILMFFMFFLTNAAGINPAFAGTIMLVATLIDAIMNPIIGHLSDNCTSKYGRRRPFFMGAAIPLSLAIILMFSNFGMSEGAKNIYFMVITVVFWMSYTTYYIPYTSLGAEITEDYNERTKLRMPATLFNYLGNILGMSAPLFIVGLLMDRGMAIDAAWNKVAIIVAIATFVAIFITWVTTKGKELKISKEDIARAKEESIFKVYFNVIKMKPYKYLMAICLLFIFGYTIFNADMIYFVQYKVGLTESQMSMVTLIFILFGMILVPIVTFMGTKIGKKNTMAICFGISAAAMIVFKFINIDSFALVLVYMLIFGIGNCAYWQMAPAIIYDMAEVYEYKYGERKEGAVTGLAIFAVKVGSALAAQTLGIILAISGYNSDSLEQTSRAIAGIENAYTIIPAVIFILAVIVLIVFPITNKNYDLLLKALEKKRNGEEHSTEGLERII